MGYTKEGSITNYWPDNTDIELYIETSSFGYTMEEIIEKARSHFGNPELGLENINIRAEYIHTRCIYYDQYDPSDYDNFLVITLKN